MTKELLIKKREQPPIYNFREMEIGVPVLIKKSTLQKVNAASYRFRTNNLEYRFTLNSHSNGKWIWVTRIAVQTKPSKKK